MSLNRSWGIFRENLTFVESQSSDFAEILDALDFVVPHNAIFVFVCVGRFGFWMHLYLNVFVGILEGKSNDLSLIENGNDVHGHFEGNIPDGQVDDFGIFGVRHGEIHGWFPCLGNIAR